MTGGGGMLTYLSVLLADKVVDYVKSDMVLGLGRRPAGFIIDKLGPLLKSANSRISWASTSKRTQNKRA
ncbi:hypothetical protein DH2020_019887 [Rehmannia glutinosa]|uniref:Uncharacterized protein n=1 Tax=Rehmannia glutinosa TaxID=99300 RepID=A0ABR0WEH7_REHGL